MTLTLLEKIIQMTKMISILVEGTMFFVRPPRNSMPRIGSSGASKGHTELDRMFATRLNLNGPVDFTQEAICQGIWRLWLKGWMESIRELVFSQHALHQLQVDVTFIRRILPQLVQDTSIIEYQVELLILTATERSWEPTLMESGVVAAITSTKQASCQLWDDP